MIDRSNEPTMKACDAPGNPSGSMGDIKHTTPIDPTEARFDQSDGRPFFLPNLLSARHLVL